MASKTLKLPKVGDRVIAWSPEYKKDVKVTVTHLRGTKFWGEDANERYTGLSNWRYPTEEELRPTRQSEPEKSEELKNSSTDYLSLLRYDESGNYLTRAEIVSSEHGAEYVGAVCDIQASLETWVILKVPGSKLITYLWEQVKLIQPEANPAGDSGGAEIASPEMPEETSVRNLTDVEALTEAAIAQSQGEADWDSLRYDAGGKKCLTRAQIISPQKGEQYVGLICDIHVVSNTYVALVLPDGKQIFLEKSQVKLIHPPEEENTSEAIASPDLPEETSVRNLTDVESPDEAIAPPDLPEETSVRNRTDVESLDEAIAQPPEPAHIEVREISISEIWPTRQDFNSNTSPLHAKANLLQPRNGIDGATVERYVGFFDALPPVDVFQIPGEPGYCLAGGWHRREAAIALKCEKIKARVRQGTWEDAVYFALTDNLPNAKELSKWEVERACKNFLRLLPTLPDEAIARILEDISRKYGRRKESKLSARAIGLLFGYSVDTIRRFQKDLELEDRLSQWSDKKGQRVLITPPEKPDSADARQAEKLSQLPEASRCGVVKDIWPRALNIQHDDPRLDDYRYDPSWLQLTDRPAGKFPVPKVCEVGQAVRHWLRGKEGVVVSVSEPDGLWDYGKISEKYPLVFWGDGKHEAIQPKFLEITGTADLPAIEDRIQAIQEQIKAIEGEGVISQVRHEQYNSQISRLKELAGEERQPASGYTSTEQETVAKGKSLGLSGKGEQQLPDVSHPFGKQPEDPRSTAVGVMEPPPAVPDFVTRSAYRGVPTVAALLQESLPSLSDDELKAIVKAAKQELTRRHRPEMEGDPAVRAAS